MKNKNTNSGKGKWGGTIGTGGIFGMGKKDLLAQFPVNPLFP
jgi:hypothetical protein